MMKTTLHVQFLDTNIKLYNRGAKDTRGTLKFIDRNQIDNVMFKKGKHRQTIVQKTQHRKRKTNNTNPTINWWRS